MVVSPAPDGKRLQWRDAHGSLRGEVPWVLRSDLLGPDTFLVVETADGDRCARVVSMRVLAAGATEYAVTVVSDLRGEVSWRVSYGADHKVKLFTCDPRPAEDQLNVCIRGGIPKPLFGELIGDMSAELVEGGFVDGVNTLRFERGYPCADESIENGDDEPLSGSQTE